MEEFEKMAWDRMDQRGQGIHKQFIKERGEDRGETIQGDAERYETERESQSRRPVNSKEGIESTEKGDI